MTFTKLKIGLVINPYAGIGGEAGLKGSDGLAIQARGINGDLPLKACDRTRMFFDALEPIAHKLTFFTVAGLMGEGSLRNTNFEYSLVAKPKHLEHTTACDTKNAVKNICNHNVDILIFVGGDGTARDVCDVIGCNTAKMQLAVGIPSGVKMYSGVFGVHPVAIAQLITDLSRGELTEVERCEVRDIDEIAFREGKVISRYYGELFVPKALDHVQQVKQGSAEVDELVLLDIATEVRNRIDDITEQIGGENLLVIFAPGSTTSFIQIESGLPNTLLGVDVFKNGQPLCLDANAQQLTDYVTEHLNADKDATIKLILTAIGGQGHVIGRGNQQIRPQLLLQIGRENVWLVATQAKLKNLNQRPLILDSGNSEFNKKWSGFIPVITGLNQTSLYRMEGK